MDKKKSAGQEIAISAEVIERKIYLIRGQKVMLDADPAELYHVETKSLNRAVKRNPDRFPVDFMFQATEEEAESLRYHFGASNKQEPGTATRGRPPLPAIRLHRAWRRHALISPKQQARCTDEHFNHPRFREAP